MFICGFQKNRFRRALTDWYREHKRDLPWRRTRDPYSVLVSEFMLQQTQVSGVIPYYNEWLRRFPGFAALAQASESDVLHAWQGLGYYARARNLHATAISDSAFVRCSMSIFRPWRNSDCSTTRSSAN